jgi:hypothetical protein
VSTSGGIQLVSFGASSVGTPVSGDTGNLAAAAGTATLAGVAGKTTVADGIVVTGLGATAASTVLATLTGPANTVNFALTIPAGAATAIIPLALEFPTPIAAAAPNTAVVLNVPSFGAGNTNARGTIHGRQI